MSKYLVITDSTADFTPEQIEQLGIEVIPMEFLMEDKTYLNYPDGREMTNEQFYAAMSKRQYAYYHSDYVSSFCRNI